MTFKFLQYILPFQTKKPKIAPKIKGSHYNLDEIFFSVNQRYFNNTVNTSIKWGKRGRPRKKRFKRSRIIRLGSYRPDLNLITIHPNLDEPHIPHFFIESIVHHEMCHAIAHTEHANGRRKIHTKLFKELEAKFTELKKARLWAKNNKNLLFKNSFIRNFCV